MTRRVLIVDAVPTNRIVLRVKLATAYYEVTQVASAEAAFAAIDRARPDLVLAAADLPDMTGTSFCAALRETPGAAHLPVVLILPEDDATERLAALASGADDVLARPFDDLVLLARLRSLLRARDAETELELRDDTRRALGLSEAAATYSAPPRVILVAQHIEPGTRALSKHLSTALRVPVQALAAEDALRDTDVPPDVVVILEPEVGQGSGLNVLAQMRAHPALRHAALIYVAHAHQRHEAAAALDMGASDLIAVGPNPDELALRIRNQAARKKTSDRLREDMRKGMQAAVTDPLTGLYNRRYAMPHLTRTAERAAKRGRPFAVMMADLDHFKQVNDTFGHPAGDSALMTLTDRLRNGLRASDLLARFGGEEFLAILPDTETEEAFAIAERLRHELEHTPVMLPSGETIALTISIGLAFCQPGSAGNPQDAIDASDRALYAAKEAGRNRVMGTKLLPDPGANSWTHSSTQPERILRQGSVG